MALDATGIGGKLKDIGARALDVKDALVHKVREAPKKLWETLKDLGSAGPAKRWWAQRRIHSLGTRIHRSNDRALGLRAALQTLQLDPVKNRRKIERYTAQLARQEQGVRARSVERQNYAQRMHAHYDARLARPKEVIELQGRLEQRIHDFEKKREVFSIALDRFSGNKDSEHYRKVAEALSRLSRDIDVAKIAHAQLEARIGGLKEAHANTYARLDYFSAVAKDGTAEIVRDDGSEFTPYNAPIREEMPPVYGAPRADDAEPPVVPRKRGDAEVRVDAREKHLRKLGTLPREIVSRLPAGDAAFAKAMYFSKGVQFDVRQIIGDREKMRFNASDLIEKWNAVHRGIGGARPIERREKRALEIMYTNKQLTLPQFALAVYAVSGVQRSPENIRAVISKIAEEIKENK